MGSDGFRFVEFPWSEDEPDVCRERLCTAPGRDPVRIHCEIEGASFAPDTAPENDLRPSPPPHPEEKVNLGDTPRPPATGLRPSALPLLRDPAQATPPRDGVVVMAYNVERGLRADEQIEALTNDPAMPAPDVILMSEADRGCERTACRNVARDWAKALSMNYVYGVEFVELPRLWGPAGGRLRRRCEHGNAILSRYPLGNVRLIRHDVNRSWHSCWQRLFRVGEPRLGGRMALAADVKLGERYLRLYSVHFESQGGQAYRPAQAVELAEAGLGSPHGVLVGGDMNCVEYREDLASGSATDGVTQALLGQGYADAHSAMAPEQRATSRSGYPIDLIFGRGVSFAGAGIGDKGAWGELSDHLPVWARVGVG